MSDILQTGLAWLAGQLKASVATPVVYRRGTEAVTIYATFGQKLLKLTDVDGGIVMQWTDMDFVFSAADLVIGGEATTPRRGDAIELTVGTEVQTFEVFPFGGEPAWRYSDPHQQLIRVHAKRLDRESLLG